jgi:hypothetical protein
MRSVAFRLREWRWHQSLPSFRFALTQSVHDIISPWRHTHVSGPVSSFLCHDINIVWQWRELYCIYWISQLKFTDKTSSSCVWRHQTSVHLIFDLWNQDTSNHPLFPDRCHLALSRGRGLLRGNKMTDFFITMSHHSLPANMWHKDQQCLSS